MKRRYRPGAQAVLFATLTLCLLTVAAALAGCGRAEFQAGSAPDVTAVFAKAGAVVLDKGTAENYYPGGQDAHWYVIGKEGSDEPSAVVSVLTFDTQASRNAAARDLENDRRHGTRVDGVYTAGNAVVLVKRITDKATVRLLDQAMRDAGAR